MPDRASHVGSLLLRRVRATVAALVLALVLPAAHGQEEVVFRPEPGAVEISVNTAETPTDVAGLLDLEQDIRAVVEKVLPSVVGLVIGQAQGSGVIISPDGYILTAAHVSSDPGERVIVILPDGKRVRAVSLGRNSQLDNGLVRVTDPDALPLPFAPVGESASLPLGSWTIAMGHPGGFRNDRPPVVRVGRILVNRDEYLATDNTLVGGDSGGPLFDLDGRVIGIHSRIGGRIEANIHVPVDQFLGDWDLLASGQEIERGGILRELREEFGPRATDGMEYDLRERTDEGALVTEVRPDGPGAEAGLQPGDRVIALDGTAIQNGQDMIIRQIRLDADQPVTYTVRRDDREFDVEITPVNGRNLYRGDDNPRMGIMLDQYYSGVGARVEDVLNGSPAQQAGMQPGDVIVEIDGHFVRSWPELRTVFSNLSPGDEIVVVVQRDGADVSLNVTLAAQRDLPRPD